MSSVPLISNNLSFVSIPIWVGNSFKLEQSLKKNSRSDVKLEMDGGKDTMFVLERSNT
ncbi:hypothetical protein Hanom_Chr06g00569071 [Helianthus anomalus]